MAAKIYNLANLRRDRGYRFQDRDPDMENLCSLIHASELSVASICERTALGYNKSRWTRVWCMEVPKVTRDANQEEYHEHR